MLRKVDTPRYEAFLVGYRLPEQTFADSADLPASLRPIWTAMAADAPDAARRNVQLALTEQRLFPAEEKAGLLVGLAAAQIRSGSTDDAWENARRSLDLFPWQMSAYRIQIIALSRRRRYEEANELISGIEAPKEPAVWDAPIENEEMELAKASFAWLLGQWDVVAERLQGLYASVGAMPDEIREDWFRLAFYRDRPEDAAEAAGLLIGSRPTDQADRILQTIVQSGWYAQALPLYRDAFEREPESELLRRRLVALCIKQGDLEEARRLTAPGALRTAA